MAPASRRRRALSKIFSKVCPLAFLRVGRRVRTFEDLAIVLHAPGHVGLRGHEGQQPEAVRLVGRERRGERLGGRGGGLALGGSLGGGRRRAYRGRRRGSHGCCWCFEFLTCTGAQNLFALWRGRRGRALRSKLEVLARAAGRWRGGGRARLLSRRKRARARVQLVFCLCWIGFARSKRQRRALRCAAAPSYRVCALALEHFS